MKKILSIVTLMCASALLVFPAFAAGSQTSVSPYSMKSALVLLCVITVALILFSVVFTLLTIRQGNFRSRRRRRLLQGQLYLLGCSYIATVIAIFVTIFSFNRYHDAKNPHMDADSPHSGSQSTDSSDPTAPSANPYIPEGPTISPEFTDRTNPENWKIKWEIIDHGTIVNEYERPELISFGLPEDYFKLPGISTFRGNNYRNNPTYGTVNITEGKLTQSWDTTIGTLNGWPGSGWTGQPLIVQWDEETKAIMNLYDGKKQKENLVEVIYATLDGKVYFYDLDDGSYTRDPINLGMNFKGAGSLDPRGYPIMYVGSGDYIEETAPRFYIVSLIDGSILYQKSGNDAFVQRDWVAFDSSPLIDAETDTLIWPGESGILYTLKLNTNYDKAAGTLSIRPEEVVKTRYYPERYTKDTYWIGYEPSAVIVDHYLYTSENGGMFFCIDLNTMELVWAQDTKDDSNSTPVFEWAEDGSGYLYTAPSLHWTAQEGKGSISIYKLDAKTGEIIWEVPFNCHTVEGVSGGVQSTPLLGKPGTDLEGLILYTIARTPNVGDGKLVALNTDDGSIVWEKSMDYYAWSSPIALYNEDGTSHIIVCDSVGNMSMLNAKGEVLSTLNLGSNIEATPTAFNDTIVVGTRGMKIYGIKVK